MKHIKTFLGVIALGLTLSSAHGAAILWSVANNAIKGVNVSGDVISDSTTNLGGANLYFLYGTITDDEVLTALSSSEIDTSAFSTATVLQNVTSKNAGNKPQGTTPVVSDLISATESNPFSLLIYTAVENTTYYKVVTGSQKGYDNSSALNAPTVMSFSAADVQGKTWAAVPEPSVALMGLLGIGMMIRRRRA